MKETRIIMGMPIVLEVVDKRANQQTLNKVFDYFTYIDEKFSVYKKTSEITAINKGELSEEDYSQDIKTILALSEETKRVTNGYFDIRKKNGDLDPSGLVKGWAILQASDLLKASGIKNFYVSVGGDIQVSGKNSRGAPWKIGIQNPFNPKEEYIKIIYLAAGGIATSGTYVRGQHIYSPKAENLAEIISLTVIGPNVYEADRFATAAFAMGKNGIQFIESLDGFEGYMINKNGLATLTKRFNQFTIVQQ
ncbi:MAG: FAD:protein FMN transferase [Candidatus Falkowbacteria bacterium]|nr:FAD:protein FMN transferase [Candidatus Falkowbacteria bacterium]